MKYQSLTMGYDFFFIPRKDLFEQIWSIQISKQYTNTSELQGFNDSRWLKTETPTTYKFIPQVETEKNWESNVLPLIISF